MVVEVRDYVPCKVVGKKRGGGAGGVIRTRKGLHPYGREGRGHDT